jgi:hypothetical protein
MSGLMDKAKSSLQGNDKAQNFADKQVNSRTVSPLTSVRIRPTELTFAAEVDKTTDNHGMGDKYDKKISDGINKQTNDHVFSK